MTTALDTGALSAPEQIRLAGQIALPILRVAAVDKQRRKKGQKGNRDFDSVGGEDGK